MWRELLEPINDGEYELKILFRANNYLVEDVSDNPRYFLKDIDLLVTNPETKIQKSIEVKWDKRISQTNNFFIEVSNPRSKGNQGWINFCNADFIYYGDAVNQKYYVFETEKLKNFIENEKGRLHMAATSDRSYGYIIPISEAPFTKIINL